jgi:hypothetical protein
MYSVREKQTKTFLNIKALSLFNIDCFLVLQKENSALIEDSIVGCCPFPRYI